jgi:predicted enzyme related to lactoylglutathione lyase
MIKEVAFVGYPVTDVTRARAFYENLLELKPSEENAMEGGKVWIEYDIAGVSLAISDAWEPSGQSGPSVALEVDDIDQTLARLVAGGAPLLLEKTESPVCWLAVIGDPDGNALIIHQRKLFS